MTLWWIDAGAGASGDMLLAATLALDPGNLRLAQEAVDEVLDRLDAHGEVTLSFGPAHRGGLACHRSEVRCAETVSSRHWEQIEPALTGHDLAHTVFSALAQAEADVHGIPVAEVHFHEVGALDAIADVVAVTTLVRALAPQRIVVSPVCVGSGSVDTAHGRLTVPGPAVTRLLEGVPTFAGSTPHEACTPTGAALLRTLADEFGPQPPMVVQHTGIGAGGRDTAGVPNIVRILSGTAGGQAVDVVMVETTIDDLDPRVYPDVLDAVKATGALEAWLTPVIMKHGRPGVTLSAVVPHAAAAAVRQALFRNTTTLGVRQTSVRREVLDRDHIEVLVDGHPVAVKRGLQHGRVINVQPELRDAQAAAKALGWPLHEVLDAARAVARRETGPPG